MKEANRFDKGITQNIAKVSTSSKRLIHFFGLNDGPENIAVVEASLWDYVWGHTVQTEIILCFSPMCLRVTHINAL